MRLCFLAVLLAACAHHSDGTLDPGDGDPIINPPPLDPPPAAGNPLRDAALPFAITMQPDPTHTRSIDAFESHSFFTPYGSSTFSYTDKHNTAGKNALQLNVQTAADPMDLWNNLGAIRVELPEPEDWREHPFATFDVYAEESPTILPEAHLLLRNSRGEEFWASLILGWSLFQWENYQMTFPLDGNDYDHAPFPPSILGDIVSIDFRIGRFGDGQYGPPLAGTHYHMDNFRLSGVEPWETFDGPSLGWHPTGDPGTHAGVGHKHTRNGSAGSLVIRWQSSGANVAGVSTGLLETPLDLTGMTSLRAFASAKASAPTRVRLWDGTHTYTSPVTPIAKSDDWSRVSWALPASGFDLSHVVQMTFEVTDLQARPLGTLYLDDLEAASNSSGIASFGVHAGPLENYLRWQSSGPTVVRASTVQYPTTPEEGEDVCAGERNECVHGGLQAGQTYFYTLFSDGEPVHATASQAWILFGLDNARYEIGFSPQDGALGYVKDKRAGKTVSYGGKLWHITFFDETALPTLDSSTFSPDSTTRKFSATGDQLRYDFDENGRALSLYVDIEERTEGISLRAHIDNHTGTGIRAVQLPAAISFRSDRVQQALLPIQEGALLLRNFFTSARSTHLTRPPLFADVLSLESEDGKISLYAVQDSHYQEALIPGHNPAEPVFQPNDFYYLGDPVLSTMGVEQITAIADGTQWSSVDMRLVVGDDLRTVALRYKQDNHFDDTTRYPTLKQKLEPFGMYGRLASNPIYTLEISKVTEWLKAPIGQAWEVLRTAWIPYLPKGTIFHITHWQEGALEDKHPDAQPVFYSQYGPSGELDALLDAMHADGSLVYPFTNWTVWNKPEVLTPPLSTMPMATLTLRGPTYPFIEYKGYMVKPWRDEVHAADDAMVQLYKTTFPMDMLFVDMTGERTWRYIFADDNTTMTTAYTQAVVEENRRLAKQFPLFTEGVFDRIADSVTGYCQTLRQKRWNGVLDHLGHEYVDWVPYPFAADVIHENVAFYPHDLNSEVWPAVSTALFSYHMLMGYNLYIDTVKHFGEDHYWIEVGDAFAKAVNARTFGQRLIDYKLLNDSRTHVQTVWGSVDPMTVTAYYDPDKTGAVTSVDHHKIAPDGFYATSKNVLAGVFAETFNDHPLPAGAHWITVVRDGSRLEVRQPLGSDATLHVPTPADWIAGAVQVSVILQDGSTHFRGNIFFGSGHIVLPYAAIDPETHSIVRGYSLQWTGDQ